MALLIFNLSIVVNMKKIAYLAENFGAFDNPVLDVGAIMHYSGHNVGNFAFWNAARKLFNAELVFFSFGARQEFFKREEIDGICIPAANFLNESADLGWLAKIIEYIDKPVFVLGIGAQSEHEDRIPVLKQGTIDFLKSAAVRTPFICVRGHFSKKVCETYGVNNVKVLGCPSLFTNNNINLGNEIKERWNKPIEKIVIHAASIKQHVQNAERMLFSKLLIPGFSSYVLQRPAELIKICLGEELSDSEKLYVKKINQFLSPDLNFLSFKNIIRSKGFIPYSVDSWRFFLRTHTHSLGTRIHGAMMSLSAGLPTICITHDTRTRELCDVMHVPNIPHNQVNKFTSLSDIFNYVDNSFDPVAFEENRIFIARQYIELLSQIELEPSLTLRKFI